MKDERLFITNHSDYVEMMNQRNADYRDGSALQGHCTDAHNGQFDKKCRACKEIKAKQEAAKVSQRFSNRSQATLQGSPDRTKL